MSDKIFTQINCELIGDFVIREVVYDEAENEYGVILSHNGIELCRHACNDVHQVKLVFNLVRSTIRFTLRTLCPNGAFIF